MVIRHTIKRLSLGGVFLDRYKCVGCCFIINEEDLEEGKCPVCHTDLYMKKMCEKDVVVCGHIDPQASIVICEKCGEVICPTCGSHHTHFGISRVTGYLAEVHGWGNGKIAELRDRKHYNIS